MNYKIIIYLTALFYIGLNNMAFADAGILDNIAEGYSQASIAWFEPLFNMAQKLFFLLASIEIAWTSIIWVLEKDELTSFTASLIKKIMSIGFFYALLLNSNSWIPAIIDSFIDAGQMAGGASSLTPSAILDIGLDTTASMLSKLHFSGVMDTIATGGTALFASIIIIFSFAIIASQLLIAIIESYIVISGGVIFLGFGGSRWTTDFTQKYISYAFAIGVKLFILYLLIGIGQTQVSTWPNTLETINISTVLSVMGSSLVYMFLVWQIPGMAASMLSGSPSMTAGSAMSTVASSGAMMIGGAAMSGAFGVGATKSTSGFANAAKTAWRAAESSTTSGGLVNSLSQITGAAKHFATSAYADTKAGIDQGLSRTKGGRMSDIIKENAAASTLYSATNGARTTATNPNENITNAPTANSSSAITSQSSKANLASNSYSSSSSSQNKPKATPTSIEEGLKNIAKSANKTNAPHDTAPPAAVNIKLNHTES